MSFIRGVMLEGISCASKTSTFLAIRQRHAERAGCERSIVALGEAYSQVLYQVGNERKRLSQGAHLALLSERIAMLKQLNSWVASMGEARRQSRGLFVLLERFYLNDVAAFDKRFHGIEECCRSLGLTCVLLTVTDENIANRICMRDAQMKIHRPPAEIERQATNYAADQASLLAAAKSVSIPLRSINTDSMDWLSIADQILSFSDHA